MQFVSEEIFVIMRTTTMIAVAGLLTFGGLGLQAGTSVNFDFNTQSSSGLQTDSGYAVSPYTGTVGGTTVQLFCDDFNDNITYGQQNIAAYQTAMPAIGSSASVALQDQTRYGVANPSTGANYPAGTKLYDEMAWLATQMLAVSGTNASYNEIAIQEAIWTLTNNTTVNDGLSPENQKTTQTGTYGDTGVEQSYLQWITDAKNDYSTSVGGYAGLVTANWSIVTAVSSAGCTIGSNGTTGCTPGQPGTKSSSGWVTQEFLAYTGGTPIINQGGSNPSTPEPASFLLIGSGLARRRDLRSSPQAHQLIPSQSRIQTGWLTEMVRQPVAFNPGFRVLQYRSVNGAVYRALYRLSVGHILKLLVA